MSVHILPNRKIAEERFHRTEKLANLSEIHPLLKDAKVRKAISALLDNTPKTGDDIVEILESVRGKSAYILKLLEDPKIMEALGMRRTLISKIELFSIEIFENEIIDRNVPSEFLYTKSNQKLRAKAYSLWK